MNNTSLPYSKTEIKKGLERAFESFDHYISHLDEEDLWEPQGIKWSAAENFAHLIMSSFPVANALKQSKIFFRAFGLSNQGSMSFEELQMKYEKLLATGVGATSRYIPGNDDLSSREEMLKNWRMILHKLLDRMENWSEAELDKYRLPHPRLGKLTFREMLFFTIFHTDHHLRIIKSRAKK